MPEFAYLARDPAGQQVTGELSAASRQEALTLLSQKALFPVRVEAEAPSAGAFLRRRISAGLLATTYAQLADLIRSGVPLLRSLEVVRRQTSHAALGEVLADLKRRVEDGSSLADAMQRHPRVFGEMAISMVRAGGEGGFLEAALDRVATFTEQQQDLKGRVAAALAYPIFLAVAGSIVVTVLIVFFVPKFAELFAQLRARGELPWMTRALLALSDSLRAWGWVWLLAGCAAAVYARTALRTERGRLWRDRWKIRLPLAGPIFLHLAVARFCRVLGNMLQNGVPILKSLAISSDAAGNRVISQAVQAAAENISSGESLAVPLSTSGHFPPAVVEMIAVAEEANTLETVLVGIADGLERRTWRRLDVAVRLLEPLMLLILAGVVLCVVIALLLPIIKMSTTLQ